MGTRKVELGDVGHVVSAQIRRRREEKRLSLQALSDRLGALGRPILASGLSKIEAGTRRVDVDDLVALADALETVPSALLTDPAKADFRPTGETMEAYENAIDSATAALYLCEEAGLATRWEVLEWMSQSDRVRAMFKTMNMGKTLRSFGAEFLQSPAVRKALRSAKQVRAAELRRQADELEASGDSEFPGIPLRTTVKHRLTATEESGGDGER